MVTVPPYLKNGDTIGVICPAGHMPLEKAQTCLNVLQQWGYTVQIGATLPGHSDNYFSAPDEARLNDLQRMLDNAAVKAVLCARGGYGLGRIIDRINFDAFKRMPKWIIGFSDVTVLHAHLYARFSIASLHAPMAAAFNDDDGNSASVLSLRRALEGEKATYHCDVHALNREGEAAGELVGGNLTLLAHCTGTPSDIKTSGRILFLEDVGEYLYNIDRMLYQLKRSGKLDQLAGLIIGGFTDNKDTVRPFGKSAYDIIYDVVKEYDYPVCFNFPISHDTQNYALKIGVRYTLTVGKNKVTLEE